MRKPPPGIGELQVKAGTREGRTQSANEFSNRPVKSSGMGDRCNILSIDALHYHSTLRAKPELIQG